MTTPASPPEALAARMDGDAARYREQAALASAQLNVHAGHYATGRSDGLVAAASDVLQVLAPRWAELLAELEELRAGRQRRLHLAGERDAARSELSRLLRMFTRDKGGRWRASVDGGVLGRMAVNGGIPVDLVSGEPVAFGQELTREKLIAAATGLHDSECGSCDRKYRMSCPNMASAILRSGPAARDSRRAGEAAFAVGDRVLITASGHPWKGRTGTIGEPFESASVPELRWTVALDDGWSTAAVAEQDIRRADS